MLTRRQLALRDLERARFILKDMLILRSCQYPSYREMMTQRVLHRPDVTMGGQLLTFVAPRLENKVRGRVKMSVLCPKPLKFNTIRLRRAASRIIRTSGVDRDVFSCHSMHLTSDDGISACLLEVQSYDMKKGHIEQIAAAITAWAAQDSFRGLLSRQYANHPGVDPFFPPATDYDLVGFKSSIDRV